MSRRWIACQTENDFFGDERKKEKKERKIASKKDRSKYKKTDLDKLQKPFIPSLEGALFGKILSISSRGAKVLCEKTLYLCTLKGSLKQENSRQKNLMTVGDNVYFFPAPNQEGTIIHIAPRTTFLSRADNLSRRKTQLIAANIDLVIITCCLLTPPLKPFLIDRYLIAAKKGHLKPLIVLNKWDLYQTASLQEKEQVQEFLNAYPVLKVSTKTGEGIEALKTAMQGHSSVFSGQSGVGKSSLINTLTGLHLKTQETVQKTNKGAHTTTAASLLVLPFGGFCVDTPGIKSFGVFDLKEEELASFFEEIEEVGKHCRFRGCRHEEEEDCCVKQAAALGQISKLKLASYLALLKSLREKHLPR